MRGDTRGIGTARTATVGMCLALVVALVVPTAALAAIDPDPAEFMPYPDGYQFSNYGGYGDWALFSDVFGGKVHLWSLGDTKYFYNSFQPSFGGGVCYGFAETAGMFYRDVYGPDPDDFDPGAAVTWDIPQATRNGGTGQLDEDIERHISKYYFYQYSPEIQSHRAGSYKAEHGDILVQLVEDELEAGWNDPWTLGFWWPGGGHAINILDVERSGDSATFYVYDNNAPDDLVDPREIREFEWTPEEYIYGGKDITKIALYPVSPHEMDHIDKWWGDQSIADRFILVSIVPDPDIYVVFVDQFERRFGRTATAVFDEIPDAEEMVPMTGLPDTDWVAPTQYYLPMDDYRIDLLSMGIGDIDYTLFAGDSVFSVQAVGDGAQTAQVHALVSEQAFSFEPGLWAGNIQAELIRTLEGGAEHALRVSGLSAAAGESLHITPTVGADAFSVRFAGGRDAIADLTLFHASDSVQLTDTMPGVELPAGASLSIEPTDWDRLETMPIYVRTLMPDGSESTAVHNATLDTLGLLLYELYAAGDIPTLGHVNSLQMHAANVPPHALERYLAALVRGRRITQETADLIQGAADAVWAERLAKRRLRRR